MRMHDPAAKVETSDQPDGKSIPPSDVKLSVVVPCFNEQDGLHELHRRVTAVCRSLEKLNGSYEIVLVDDGSRDGTWPLMQTLAAEDDHVVAIKLSRNYGHQKALSAGLMNCLGERIFIIDADLQDPPQLLVKMMKELDDGADVAFGQRSQRSGETWFKLRTASMFYRLLSRLSDVEIPVDTGDFRLMSRKALNVLNSMPEEHRFIRGMVSWIGLKQVAVPYEREERFAGSTKYTLAKMLRFAIDAITGFSIVPLRIASILGVVFGIGGLLLLIYVFGGWLAGVTVQGWTSLAAIVLVLGSAQLLVLGVIGEYLGRLYMGAKHRPLFVIETIVRT